MNRDVGGELLRSVSRSFYLTIAILPPDLRAPIGTAYLLARASDTIADTVTVAASERLRHLQSFREAVVGQRQVPITEIRGNIIPSDPSELRLMDRVGDCLEFLENQPEEDRQLIRSVVDVIIGGQIFDIKRFWSNGPICSLQTAEELHQYTWMVAGCVGEFWTHICMNHNAKCARLSRERLVRLGANFGKGLQLVNILRDAPADLRAGRCYLPSVQLNAAGTQPAELVEHPERARPVVEQWRRVAVRHLGDAAYYVMAIRPLRLRFACFLPWYLGLRTLQLLARRPALETNGKIKVSRNEVRIVLALAPLAACSNSFIRRLHETLTQGALDPHRPVG